MARIYYTEQGDCWDKIAYNELGSEKYMGALIEANWPLIDVLVFSAGTEIIIPDLTETQTEDLPPWRSDDDYDAGIEPEVDEE